MPGNLHELRVREMLPRKGVSVGPKRFLHREEDFFITLKPLTYLMRFWGIFSLDTRLHFAILSFSWMWCFLVTMILIVVQVFEKNQELRQLKSPLYISRTVLVGFTTLIYDKDMPDLIVSITKFDATYFKTFNVKEKYGRLSRGSTWLYINFITWAIILSDFFEDEEILYGRFFSYVGRQMSTYLYMFFCIHLIIRFRNLRKKWNHQIQMITNTTYINVEVWEKHLEHSRLLYHYLCTLVIKLSNCYGFKLSVNIMTMFLTILLDLYEYLYVLGEFHMNHTIGTIFEFVTIILICIISGKVTWEVNILIIILNLRINI